MNLREKALQIPLDSRSIELRKLILNAVAYAGRGHIGPSLSLIEIVSTLYDSVLNHYPLEPNSSNRDILVLSKGHGCLGLYAVLAQHGYFPIEELNSFCSYNSRLGGHPEWHNLPGIEFSTGSLGHGLSVASGIAKAFQIRKSQRRVFVIIGDGELAEGEIWESAMHISKHRLNNLTLFVDYNNMQAYGELDEVLPVGELASKWSSFGFRVLEINGHSRKEIAESTKKSDSDSRPTVVIAHTVKGKGIYKAENSKEWHHKARISRDDINELLEQY